MTWRFGPELDDLCDVLVEPLPGHSDDEVVHRLEELGVVTVRVMGPGFISVRAAVATLEEVCCIAHVHPKNEHRHHR